MDCNIEIEIGRLSTLPLGELRRAWQRHHPRTALPDRLPRDLLVRTIAWQLQVKDQGDIAPPVCFM